MQPAVHWIATLWPLAAGIVCAAGYVYGTLKGYWRLNEKADVSSKQAAAALLLAQQAHTAIQALRERVVALETRQADILKHVEFIRDHMLMDPVRVRYARKRDRQRERDRGAAADDQG